MEELLANQASPMRDVSTNRRITAKNRRIAFYYIPIVYTLLHLAREEGGREQARYSSGKERMQEAETFPPCNKGNELLLRWQKRQFKTAI